MYTYRGGRWPMVWAVTHETVKPNIGAHICMQAYMHAMRGSMSHMGVILVRSWVRAIASYLVRDVLKNKKDSCLASYYL